MPFLHRVSPHATVALAALFFSAGCAAPELLESTSTSVFATALLSPTCTGILCTPEGSESGPCATCRNDPTVTPTVGTQSATLTPRPGFEFTPPSMLAQQGLLALTLRRKEYSHIWLWPMGLPNPVALTAGAFDDRDPVFSPDGGSLAFSSQRDGSWDIYILDLSSGELQRLTDSAEYETHPSWSPDSRQMVYERYVNGHFRISIRRVEDQALMWPGPEGMDSFEPNWSSLARRISFTGRMNGQTDIFLLNLDTQEIFNLTNTPDLDEHAPAFSPDGAVIAYSVKHDGYSWIYRLPLGEENGEPRLVGQGDRPEWSPDGKWLVGVFQPDLLESYLLFSPSDRQVLSPAALWLPGRVEKLAWTSAVLPNPLPAWISGLSESGLDPTATHPPAGTPLTAQLVDLDVNAPDPRLSSAVVQRFHALREAVKKQAGWDFLGTLDNAVIGLDTPMPPRETLSWLRTGRAFAISRAAVAKGWLVVLPDPVGATDYWRLYIRTAQQKGSLGSPLYGFPWNFDARTSGTPSAFDSGGQYYGQIPSGYFMDLSQLAAEYGFQRIPSDPDWRTYYFGIHFWEFVCTDGLDWYSAMSELYSPYAFLTPTISPTP